MAGRTELVYDIKVSLDLSYAKLKHINLLQTVHNVAITAQYKQHILSIFKSDQNCYQ